MQRVPPSNVLPQELLRTYVREVELEQVRRLTREETSPHLEERLRRQRRRSHLPSLILLICAAAWFLLS